MMATGPEFQTEEQARQHLETLRWPQGPVCPHCRNHGAWRIEGGRPGLYKCAAYACGAQFTVTVRSAFEGSKVPLRKWLLAVERMCAETDLSSRDLARELRVTYKTAWLMRQRIHRALVGSDKVGSRNSDCGEKNIGGSGISSSNTKREPVLGRCRTSHERIEP
ncbi:MAG: transposase [Gammaproteobacteria bacterium]